MKGDKLSTKWQYLKEINIQILEQLLFWHNCRTIKNILSDYAFHPEPLIYDFYVHSNFCVLSLFVGFFPLKYNLQALNKAFS